MSTRQGNMVRAWVVMVASLPMVGSYLAGGWWMIPGWLVAGYLFYQGWTFADLVDWNVMEMEHRKDWHFKDQVLNRVVCELDPECDLLP